MWEESEDKQIKPEGYFFSTEHLLPCSQTTSVSDMVWFSSFSSKSTQNLKICGDTDCWVIKRDTDLKISSSDL